MANQPDNDRDNSKNADKTFFIILAIIAAICICLIMAANALFSSFS
jgi:hypothetical protein